jgi:hypothetical protein
MRAGIHNRALLTVGTAGVERKHETGDMEAPQVRKAISGQLNLSNQV